MTYQTPAGLTAPLHALAGRLAELKDRVREAVAVEVGRILGDAVRDLITATFRGRLPLPAATPAPRPGRVHNSGWDDDPDDWNRDGDEELDPYEPKPEPPTRAPAAENTPRVGWVAALAGGAYVARSWAGRTGMWWVGAAVGVMTAAAAVFNNTVVGATLSVVTAFAGLLYGVLPTPSCLPLPTPAETRYAAPDSRRG